MQSPGNPRWSASQPHQASREPHAAYSSPRAGQLQNFAWAAFGLPLKQAGNGLIDADLHKKHLLSILRCSSTLRGRLSALEPTGNGLVQAEATAKWLMPCSSELPDPAIFSKEPAMAIAVQRDLPCASQNWAAWKCCSCSPSWPITRAGHFSTAESSKLPHRCVFIGVLQGMKGARVCARATLHQPGAQ